MALSQLDVLSAVNAATSAAQAAAAQARSAATSAARSAAGLNSIALTALFWEGTWDSSKLYAKYAVVDLDDTLYMSLAPANKGNSPDSSPSLWQHFATGGGGGVFPSSEITGLGFANVEGVPTLQEQGMGVVFESGLSVGGSGFSAMGALLQVVTGAITSTLVGSDELVFQTESGLSGISVQREQTQIWGSLIVIGNGNSDTINIANNLSDQVNMGLNSGGIDPLFHLNPGFAGFRLGSTDTFLVGLEDNETFLQITEESVLFRVTGGTFEVQADQVIIHGESPGAGLNIGTGDGAVINLGQTGDTVNLAGSIVLHGYQLFNPQKGPDVVINGADVALTPGTTVASEYVVYLNSSQNLQLNNDGPPMDGQLVRLILPATNGFTLTIIDALTAVLFTFPSFIPGGAAAAATFRYTDTGWIFAGSEYVDNT